MIKLRTALQTYLKSKHSRIYFQTAAEDATYPYVVYELSAFDDGEGHQLVTVDVDVWDAPPNGDTTALEIGRASCWVSLFL